MEFKEETVLKILAIGLDNSNPDHRLNYLLKKLYGKDSLNLDSGNSEFLARIKRVALEFNEDEEWTCQKCGLVACKSDYLEKGCPNCGE